MSWQLTILIHSFLSGARSVQSRRLGRFKQDVSIYTLVASYFSVALLGLTIAVINGETIQHHAAWDERYFLLLGGTLFAVGNYFLLQLFRHVPASVAVMMGLLTSLSVLMFASLVANETLTLQQWGGAALLLMAVAIVERGSRHKESKKVRRSISVGLVVAVVSSLLIGSAVVNEKYLLDSLQLETYLVYGWGMQFVASLGVAWALRKRFTWPEQSAVHGNVWLYAGLLAFAGIFFVLTLVESDSSSLTAVSANAKVIMAMLLSYVVLHERDHMKSKLAGLVLSTVGLFLLFS